MSTRRERPTSHEARRAAGTAVLDALDGSGDRRALRARLAEIAPDFADLTVEVAYGDFWSRPGLDLATREIATVAALCALGRDRQLAGHLRSALRVGVSRQQLVEVLMQMAIYAGWPAAIDGLLAARDAFAEPQACHVLHIGATRVTVVSDGYAELPAEMFCAAGVGSERIHAILHEHGLPTESVRLSLNGLVLEHRGQVIVVDPGSGPHDGPHAHGLVAPTQGQFLTNFRAAGFDVGDVDLVVLTHGHHDHAGGTLAADGGLTFPSARVAMSQAEFEHWRDVGDYGEATVPAALAIGGRAVGRALTAAIADRVTWLVDEHEIAPGLRALDAAGHTCGQMALLLEDKEQALLIGADAATHEIIQLAEPDSHMIVDYDGAQGLATRRRLLQRAASDQPLFHAFHFAWPGIGRIAERDSAWRFDPSPAGGP